VVTDTTAGAGRPVPAGGITRARGAATRIGKGQPRSAAAAAAKGVRTALQPSTRHVSIWHASPPALADLARDVREGEFMPGEQHPWLEALGRWYGRVALGWVAACYALAWVGAKPGRFLGAVFVASVIAGAVFWP
jgi:hypothetical protein